MTLYYTIVFLILVIEIAFFLVLMIPMPNNWRKRMFMFLSTNPEIHICAVYWQVLDSINRLQTIQNAVFPTEGVDNTAPVHDARTDANLAAKKFYAQRNMYLTGSTLFLTLVLRHIYNLTLDVVRLQDENGRLTSSSTTTSSEKPPSPKRSIKVSTPSSSTEKTHVE
ncbi:hypothetical protein K492DRAFT_197534 [Lichtheimia hyalospora FSU 10163]|nr:hypothetical protein K492DRAFT_197534 [Lichtheimia hyalospora FSU 10163]